MSLSKSSKRRRVERTLSIGGKKTRNKVKKNKRKYNKKKKRNKTKRIIFGGTIQEDYE